MRGQENQRRKGVQVLGRGLGSLDDLHRFPEEPKPVGQEC